jgi:hypothetical protein
MTPITVLHIDVENTRRQSRRRYRPLRIQAGGKLEPERLRIELRTAGLDLTTDADRDWLLDTARYVKPDLLLIGPIYKLANGDPTEEKSAKPVAMAIDAVRDQTDCAVILEAHAAKAPTGRRNAPTSPTAGPGGSAGQRSASGSTRTATSPPGAEPAKNAPGPTSSNAAANGPGPPASTKTPVPTCSGTPPRNKPVPTRSDTTPEQPPSDLRKQPPHHTCSNCSETVRNTENLVPSQTSQNKISHHVSAGQRLFRLFPYYVGRGGYTPRHPLPTQSRADR